MKSVTLKNAEITLVKSNLLKITLKDDSYLNKIDIIEIQKVKNKLVGENSYALLLQEGNAASSSTEAYEYWAGTESFKNRTAKAIVIKTLAQRLNWDVFIRRNKMLSPVKIFSSEPEALIWLSDFIG